MLYVTKGGKDSAVRQCPELKTVRGRQQQINAMTKTLSAA